GAGEYGHRLLGAVVERRLVEGVGEGEVLGVEVVAVDGHRGAARGAVRAAAGHRGTGRVVVRDHHIVGVAGRADERDVRLVGRDGYQLPVRAGLDGDRVSAGVAGRDRVHRRLHVGEVAAAVLGDHGGVSGGRRSGGRPGRGTRRRRSRGRGGR